MGSLEFLGRATPSFTDFLARNQPGLLPGLPEASGTGLAGGEPGASQRAAGDPLAVLPQGAALLPHGTTLVAVQCAGGVVLAGDRRATAGNMIVKRDVQKVFRSDEFSAIGIAGVAGIAMEFVRLFQVELEHYEKMEGRPLSLAGKANRLATMIRGNLMGAMQGLAAVPLFVGYDEDSGRGRIFSYDVAGGVYEEERFHSIGSGSVFARGAMKKFYAEDMTPGNAILACVQALYDAADDDSATGGPDLSRGIFPVIATVTAAGFQRMSDADSADVARAVVTGRMAAPDGPVAPLSASAARPELT